MLATAGLRIDQAPPLHLPFRFFGTAPVFAILAGGMLLWGGVPDAALLPESVALVHLAVLGWLLMTLFGALFQMIPVLAGIPVPWPGSVPWFHALFTLGSLSLVLGVGLGLWHPWLLAVAFLALALSVGGFILPIALALLRAPARHPTVNAMRISLICLAATLGLGLLFLAEYAHGFLDLDRQALVGIHLTWGLVGVMGVMIIGVSFQVLPMFYMTPPFSSRAAEGILIGLGLFLVAMPAVLLGVGVDQPVWLAVAALPGVAAVVAYGVEIRRLLAGRKRRLVDATLWFWRFGFASGLAALLLLASWTLWDHEALRLLFGIFYILGWVVSVMTGMLHKIIPFLVWFHRFSPLAGLREIPMMDDLSPAKAVNAQVVIHVASVLALALAVAGGWAWVAQLGGAGLMVVGGISLHALWVALRVPVPEAPEMPDFASFFKEMPGNPPGGG